MVPTVIYRTAASPVAEAQRSSPQRPEAPFTTYMEMPLKEHGGARGRCSAARHQPVYDKTCHGPRASGCDGNNRTRLARGARILDLPVAELATMACILAMRRRSDLSARRTTTPPSGS